MVDKNFGQKNLIQRSQQYLIENIQNAGKLWRIGVFSDSPLLDREAAQPSILQEMEGTLSVKEGTTLLLEILSFSGDFIAEN